MTDQQQSARLALEDGTVFHGRAFGAVDPPQSTPGEVVFNTAMTGYQEAISDPSYTGQILCMTAPEIGNYGIATEDGESDRPQVSGFVIRERSRTTSNYRSKIDLSTWLQRAGVLGIEHMDTRALVRKLRVEGAMRGVISSDGSVSDDALIEMAAHAPMMAGANLADRCTPEQPSRWTETLGAWPLARPVEHETSSTPLRIVALDCGAKHNIYRHLAELGCEVWAVPNGMAPADIRSMEPDGLMVSNGPGDPAAVERTVETLRELAGETPTFGICLGHQLLARALGARTFKLKFGHHGTNQPVRNVLTGQVEITSQNHGFSVDPDSLADAGAEVTHVHLNDQTIAGFRLIVRPLFSVQYHPEASPWPHDSAYLFDCFIEMMRSGRPVDGEMMLRAQRRRVQLPAGVPG